VSLSTEQFPASLRPILRYFHVDFQPLTPPRWLNWLVASVVAVVGSLGADWLLVKLGVLLYPAQKHYAHFQFSDYAKLTVIGVIVACLGWPVVARISSQPKWLFFRLAVLATVVLLLPDVAIWFLGQPFDGVFVLVWMHLAIAAVTYLALILIAPVQGRHPSA